jgi:hypothetical protein
MWNGTKSINQICKWKRIRGKLKKINSAKTYKTNGETVLIGSYIRQTAIN